MGVQDRCEHVPITPADVEDLGEAAPVKALRDLRRLHQYQADQDHHGQRRWLADGQRSEQADPGRREQNQDRDNIDARRTAAGSDSGTSVRRARC